MLCRCITGVVTAVLFLSPATTAWGGEAAGSLEEVLRFTFDTHEALRIAGEDVEQAYLRKRRFLMSLTPDLSLQAYSQRVGGDFGATSNGGEGQGGGESGPVFFPEGTYYGYSFNLTQPLYTGGRAISAYRGAGDQEDAVRIQEDIVRRDLLVSAAEGYYTVLAAMEAVRIGEQAVVRAQRNLELAVRRLELGEGVQTDRLRAEVNLADRESNLIGFRRALADSREAVRRFCGRPLSTDPLPADPLPEVEGSLEELVQRALEKRPELERDRYGISAAEEDVKEKKGRFLPAFYAAASYYGSGEEVNAQETGWQAGLFMELPIYERASRFYLLNESRSALRQAVLRKEGRARDIALEIGRLYNALAASKARLATLRKQVEFAKENNRLAEKRFAVGLADSLETVDTQTALIEAEVGLTAERLQYEIAKLRLAKALGGELFPGIPILPGGEGPAGAAADEGSER